DAEVAETEPEYFARSPAPFTPSAQPARLDGLRVLFVDDDPDARELLAALLERSGAEVIGAESANEALEAVRKCAPDVLVSDIGLPNEDGYMLIRRVRALPASEGGLVP